jgi:microcystin-dependent protein
MQVSGNTLTANEGVQFNKGLTVFGAQTTIQNGLSVSGSALLSGPTTMNSLTVSGSTLLSGETALRGTVKLADCVTTGGGVVPVGGILMWSGDSPPQGWALCDGVAKLNGKFVPDLRGRFILASGHVEGSATREVGATGGEETHKLTAAEMPEHTHNYRPDGGTMTLVTQVATGKDKPDSGAAGGYGYIDDANRSAVQAAGQSAAHTNMPPFYVLAFIIRMD